MAKDKKQKEKSPVIQLDNQEYKFDELNEDQKLMVSHIADLNRKIETASFNLQQLQFGRQAFIDSLKAGLNSEE